jgi:di/tricarboxylate transporter
MDFWLTLAILGLMIIGLLQERLTPDTLVFGALVLLMLTGVLEPAEALGGFASSTVFTVLALFIVAGAMQRTGALDGVSRRLFGAVQSLRSALLRLMGTATVASAFLNNTPIVAVLLPMVLAWAKRLRISPSKLLIPLSYAAVVGGVCTLIGTSTNLVVNGLMEGRGMPGIGMFELSWIGVPCAVVTAAVVILMAPRLLPERVSVMEQIGDDERRYLVELELRDPSPLIGQSVEGAGLRHLPGLFLVRIERSTGAISPVGPGERLQLGDRLTFAGVVDTIVDLKKFRGLVPAAQDQSAREDQQWSMHEAVVAEGSPLVGQNIRDAGFRGRYSAAVLAVHRHGERVESKIGDIVLRPGDVLLIEAPPAFARSFRNSTDFYLVSEVEDSAPPLHQRSGWASIILASVVLLAATGLVPIVLAALGGAGAAVALRCISPGDAHRTINLSVLGVIGASLGLAKALEKRGVAAAVADLLVEAGQGLGPLGVLAAVYLATMLLTELISNNAAAALIFPVGIAAAIQLDVDPRPFSIAVAVAASLSLATPLGYQTNLMVYGPGGYRFGDFLRLGAPLQLILACVALTLIPLIWTF